MDAIEQKRIKVGIMKLDAAQGELELAIDKHNLEIERIEKHILLNREKVKELESKLQGGVKDGR